MRSNSKPILAAALTIVVISLSVTVALNVALRSEALQNRIRWALAPVTGGAPLRINGIYGLPFGGIRLTGISLENPSATGTSPLPPWATASSLTIVPKYRSLLQGKLEISELALEHPVIRLDLRQLQGFAKSRATPTESAPRSTPLPSTESHQSSTPSFQSTHRASTLQRLTIRQGDLGIIGLDGKPLLTLAGITFGASADNLIWTGCLDACTLLLGSSFRISELHSSLTLPGSKEEKLMTRGIRATLGGGKLEGSFECSLTPESPEYHASLKLSGASLSPLLRETGYGASTAEGRITGDLEITGIAGVPSSVNGKGSLNCNEAVIQPADFLRQIGQLLQIEELQVLRLQEGRTLFHIASGSVVIDNLMLHSQNLILSAQGPLISSGELDLQARLLFNEKLTSRLRAFLGSRLTTASEQGYSQIPFRISGPPSHPKTNLLEQLTGLRIGGGMNGLGGLIQGLFGRPPQPNPPPQTPR